MKEQAAREAVEYVRSGMIVGLGHGSTALKAVRRLAARLESGDLHDIRGVPCSTFIATEARRLGIPVAEIEAVSRIDLTIDGADEVSPDLELIKGGGGALLREKIVAQASAREIIIVDDSKLSPQLGTKWAVPVEVIPFGWKSAFDFLVALGATVTRRKIAGGELFRTDQGNLILDANFGPIPQPHALATELEARAAIVEHGLFLGLATDVIVAGRDGIKHLARNTAHT